MEMIPAQNILYMFLPLGVVWYFYYRWENNKTEILYSTIRMILQLLAIGYVLIYIFQNDSLFLGFLIILVMITMSSFIVIRNLSNKTVSTFFIIFGAIAIGGTINLIIVIEFVLDLTQFYEPKYVIPIAGMIYANSMNAVSIAGERFEKELKTLDYEKAKKIAFKTSLIPKVNSFLAVGLVSLPAHD